jgi:protein SPT2
VEYLELRERIKEQIRKQKEHGSVLSKSQEKKEKLPSDK